MTIDRENSIDWLIKLARWPDNVLVGAYNAQDMRQHSAYVLRLIDEQQKTIDLLYDLLNERCKEFRAKTEGDEVCGLCQYDGAYVGQSGDWCNECPGFETNDCFAMKNDIRKRCGKELLPEQ